MIDGDFIYRRHEKHYFLALEEADNKSAYRRISIGVITKYLWTDKRAASI